MAGSDYLAELAADPQVAADRAAMLNTVENMWAAGKDIATLPGRGLLGAANTAIVRPARALGVPVPYIPDVAPGNFRSPTPYMDELRAKRATPATGTAVQDWRAGERASYTDPAVQAAPVAQPKPKATPAMTAALSTSTPAPAVPDATPTQQARFKELATKPIRTEYDNQAAMMHDLFVMLGAAGDFEGAMQARTAFMTAHGGRNKAQAEMALNALTGGDIEPAIAVMNHTIPNGRQIVGYSADSDGKKFTLRYSDGQTEDTTREAIGQAMIGMRDPDVWANILKARETKKAELAGQTQLKAYEYGLNVSKAQLEHALNVQRDSLKILGEAESKMWLKQNGYDEKDPTVRMAFHPIDPTKQYVLRGSQAFELTKDPNGRPAYKEVVLPGAAPAPSTMRPRAPAAPSAGTIAGVPTKYPGIFE